MILLRSVFKVGLSLVFVLGLSACGSDKKEEDTSPCAAANAIVADATYASLWANVFSGRCGSCHGVADNTGTLGGPDMRTKEVFHRQLVGKTIRNYDDWNQAQNNVKCLDTPLINAKNSAESLVVAVLDPTVLPDCGVKPHRQAEPQNVCISNGSLAALKKWIDNGAPEQ
jgi:hypothetical protein